MKLPLFQLDAFASKLFAGNPAAVCPLRVWLKAELMQAIAAENNVSETAFFVKGSKDYELRWFTPTVEIDLCGHATLAAAAVIFQYFEPNASTVRFTTKSGILTVTKQDEALTLDLPVIAAQPIGEVDLALLAAFNLTPRRVLQAVNRNYLLVFDSEQQIQNLTPDFNALAQLGGIGVIVTARGEEVDFVSRFFAPGQGIQEDPVTGSAHCTLVPYWAEELKQTEFKARQLSVRGGELSCLLSDNRVFMTGKVVFYFEGNITI